MAYKQIKNPARLYLFWKKKQKLKYFHGWDDDRNVHFLFSEWPVYLHYIIY